MSDGPAPAADLPEQVRVRREKYDRLLAGGTAPYALGAPRTHSLAEVRGQYAHLETDTASGDVVSITGDGVTVNGALLPETEPHTQDSRGWPLVPRVVVQVVVEPGDLWVVSNHSPLSIDSRYFGPIRAGSVEGTAVPVWVGR